MGGAIDPDIEALLLLVNKKEIIEFQSVLDTNYRGFVDTKEDDEEEKPSARRLKSASVWKSFVTLALIIVGLVL